MNLENLVSNHDLVKFCKSQNLSHNCIFFDNNLPPLEDLFPGTNNFAIVFLINEGIDVGHWTLMINHSSPKRKIVEYFDCLGEKPRLPMMKRIQESDYEVIFLNSPLMAPNGTLCGKYCIARIMSKDTPLQIFYEILKSNRIYSPDEIIELMYRIRV